MNRKEQEKKELSEYPCPEKDDLETTGVLLSDEIEHYATKYRMIDPFNPDNLGPARYELTVGNEYSIGGKTEKLYDEPGKNEIRIPPFEVVVIKTNERVNLPRFIVARWNIRVKWAYEGLLWVGGPQVDPGWVGHLPCPIYNLSDKEVTLRLEEQIAVMDFVKTTPFKEGPSKGYDRPPKRVIFDDYNPESLKSALFTEAAQRLNKMESKVNRVESLIGIMFASIAVLFAVLSIIFTTDKELYIPIWIIFSVALSIIAIAISLLWRVKLKMDKEIREKWFKIVVIAYIVGSAIAIAILWMR